MGCVCGAASCRTGNSCSISSTPKYAPKEPTRYEDDPLTIHKLSRLTAHLCFVLHTIESESPEALNAILLAAERHEDGQGLIKWWDTHQKLDTERAARERAGGLLAKLAAKLTGKKGKTI